MSAIIAICSCDYCAFIADLRMVNINSNSTITVNSNNIHKIFKLNNKLIFGATGKFENNENILSPLKMYPTYDYLSFEMLDNAIHEYTITSISKIRSCGNRRYIFGGVTSDDEFCVKMYSYNAQTGRFCEDVLKPTSNGVGWRLLIPSKAVTNQDKYTLTIKNAIQTQSINKIIQSAQSVIKEISIIDDTVCEETIYYDIKRSDILTTPFA